MHGRGVVTGGPSAREQSGPDSLPAHSGGSGGGGETAKCLSGPPAGRLTDWPRGGGGQHRPGMGLIRDNVTQRLLGAKILSGRATG